MSHQLGRVRESDFEYYERIYYKDLKDYYYDFRVSKSSYRCPFCSDKQNYLLNEFLKHALRFGKDSGSTRIKELAKHSALRLYIERYLDVNDRPEKNIYGKSGEILNNRSAERYLDVNDRPEKNIYGKSGKVLDNRSAEVVIDRSGEGEVASGRSGKFVDDRSEKVGKDQLFVWPCVGIVANIPTEFKNGKRVGESGAKLKNEFTLKGFNPLKVQPLWNRNGHSGYAVVEFSHDWEGFTNGTNFEKSFVAEHCGKMDYYNLKHRSDRLYGWVARDDDYHSKSIIGDHLRRTGDLHTVSGKQAEEKRKNSMLVSDLANILKVKNEKLEQVCSKYDDASVSLKRVMDEKEAIIESFNNEIKRRQQNNRKDWEKIYMDHEKARRDLRAWRKKLEDREKDLQKCQVQNQNEREKLYLQRKNNEMAIMEQNKADEKVMSLAEEHKKEKENLHQKILELQSKLDAKQTLELEIEQMKGALQVMEHMTEDDDMEKKNLEAIKADLQDKEEELEDLEALQQALVVKERKTNDELQDARKELIRCWLGKSNSGRQPFVGVKRMGELDGRAFWKAAKRKFSDDEAKLKAVELCSQYEAYLGDPNWYPFKVLTDQKGNSKEVLDEEDEKLKTLKDEFGDEVFGAVVRALMELNEYNPSGRYPLPELWNFKEERKALLKEGVSKLLQQWKSSRQLQRRK